MTYGEAVQDPTTRLGAAAARMSADRAERLEAAKKIAADRGIDLHEALQLWHARAV